MTDVSETVSGINAAECPYCGQEMQKGILSGDGRSAVTFKPGEKKTGWFDRFLSIGAVTAAKHTLAAFTIDAYYCGSCKKMIFDTDIKQ